jgi:hypothetical protein
VFAFRTARHRNLAGHRVSVRRRVALGVQSVVGGFSGRQCQSRGDRQADMLPNSKPSGSGGSVVGTVHFGPRAGFGSFHLGRR